MVNTVLLYVCILLTSWFFIRTMKNSSQRNEKRLGKSKQLFNFICSYWLCWWWWRLVKKGISLTSSHEKILDVGSWLKKRNSGNLLGRLPFYRWLEHEAPVIQVWMFWYTSLYRHISILLMEQDQQLMNFILSWG